MVAPSYFGLSSTASGCTPRQGMVSSHSNAPFIRQVTSFKATACFQPPAPPPNNGIGCFIPCRMEYIPFLNQTKGGWKIGHPKRQPTSNGGVSSQRVVRLPGGISSPTRKNGHQQYQSVEGLSRWMCHIWGEVAPLTKSDGCHPSSISYTRGPS